MAQVNSFFHSHRGFSPVVDERKKIPEPFQRFRFSSSETVETVQ
jgi:hypothetical protein